MLVLYFFCLTMSDERLNMTMKHKAILLLAVIIAISIIIPYFAIFAIILVIILSNDFTSLFDRKQPLNATSNDDKLSLFIFMKKAYLDDVVWNTKRKQALARDNYTCRGCGCTGVSMEVHHTKHYCKIPNEPLNSLVTLCRSCHEYQHFIHGFPQTYEDYMNWNAPLIKRVIK